MDTFWYIDPEKGIDGVWENSLAAEKPPSTMPISPK
jgi:peptide/nickel transport system substrate-binding protein